MYVVIVITIIEVFTFMRSLMAALRAWLTKPYSNADFSENQVTIECVITIK